MKIINFKVLKSQFLENLKPGDIVLYVNPESEEMCELILRIYPKRQMYQYFSFTHGCIDTCALEIVYTHKITISQILQH